jgi:hypothetical protein
MPDPYKAKAEPQEVERRALICVPCGHEVDPADCCSDGCPQDTVRREKRPKHLLEWHIFRFHRAEPWYIEPLAPPGGIPHRPEPAAPSPAPAPDQPSV